MVEALALQGSGDHYRRHSKLDRAGKSVVEVFKRFYISHTLIDVIFSSISKDSFISLGNAIFNLLGFFLSLRLVHYSLLISFNLLEHT